MRISPSLVTIPDRQPERSGTPLILFAPGTAHEPWCYEEFLGPFFQARGYPVAYVSYPPYPTKKPNPWSRAEQLHDAIDQLTMEQTAGTLLNGEQHITSIYRPLILVAHSASTAFFEHLLDQGVINRMQVLGAALLAPTPRTGGKLTTEEQVLIASWPQHHGPTFSPWQMGAALWRRSMAPLYNSMAKVRKLFLSNPTIAEADLARWSDHIIAQREPLFTGIFSFPKTAPTLPVLSMRPATLWLAGGRDPLTDPRAVLRTSHVYGGEFARFPDSCHDLMLDPAWPKVADTILNWIKRLVAPSLLGIGID